MGIIGAGVMGTDHARIADGLVSGSEVTVVADVDASRADALAASLGSARTAEAFDLIAAEDVDAVIIASHDASHAGFVLAAIAAGKPVLCEKPLAPTVAECDRIVQADDAVVATGGERLVSVGFMRRFDPAYTRLKSTMHDGSIGRTVLLNCQSRGVASGPGTTSDSAVTGSTIHELDIVPWLLESPIVELRWDAPRSAIDEFVDPQLLTLRTADGAVTVVETFLNARYGYDIRCEAVGVSGVAELARNDAPLVTSADLRRSTEYGRDWRPRFADAYRLEVQAWVSSIRAGAPSPLATARDGRSATALAQLAIESMHEGHAVAVPR
ncbi:MAG: Myo-inositol 2-dehydrogenase / D-chiro-inositol 1-dehydrogenase [Frondihabitans sp.]|nr:Myo-inositol 2-dehydrogenase / D-chiro-inositol 1-dehydrogenase [Frondihabitans sp.]